MADVVTTAPHGRCEGCETELATPQRLEAHLAETAAASPESRSHRVWRVNPTADQRAEQQVGNAISTALDTFCDEMDSAIHRGDITKEQVSQAVRWHSDFSDSWQNWLAEAEDQKAGA